MVCRFFWRKLAKRQNIARPKIGFDNNGEYIFYTKDPYEQALAIHWRYHPDGAMSFLKFFWPDIFEPTKKTGKEVECVVWDEQKRDYLRNISDPTIPYWWTMAYRGFAKSTILRGECARVIILRLTKFLVWTSFEQRSAIFSTETIRRLICHPRVIEWFGDLRPRSNDGMKADWGEESWQAVDPDTLLPYAAVAPISENMTMNGKNVSLGYSISRPTYIVSDDGEKRDRVDNEEFRISHRKWWFAEVEPCVPTVRPNEETQLWNVARGEQPPYLVRTIDTPKHHDCLIIRLGQMSDGRWRGKSYPVAIHNADGTFTSLCPDSKTDGQVYQLWKSACSESDEDFFWAEYMCIASRNTLYCFPASLWYYRDSESGINASDSEFRFITSDPSEFVGRCDASILACSFNSEAGVVSCRKQITGKMSWEEYVNNLFRLAKETNTTEVFIEGFNSKGIMKSNLQNEVTKRGAQIHFRHLKTVTKGIVANSDFGGTKDAAKKRRGAGFAKLFTPFIPTHPNGHVRLDESFRDGPMECQMKSYPNCSSWDALDCGGHIPQAMNEVGLWFEHQMEEGSEEKKKHDDTQSDIDQMMANNEWDTAPRCAYLEGGVL